MTPKYKYKTCTELKDTYIYPRVSGITEKEFSLYVCLRERECKQACWHMCECIGTCPLDVKYVYITNKYRYRFGPHYPLTFPLSCKSKIKQYI